MEEPRYSTKFIFGDSSLMERKEFSPEEMSVLEEDVSHTKRFCEWLVMVPGFRQEFEADPEGTVKKHGINVNAMEMFYLFDEKKAKELFGDEAPISDSVINYYWFVQNKLHYRDELQKNGCIPANKNFAKWRLRQLNRCWGEFGGANASMIHTPLAYELAQGCSVGCEFCGLDAGRLKKLFRYTPENAALWREVLEINKEIIGTGGRDAPCYYATEPLDNPDYELFIEDYLAVNGAVPQITTAVPLRNVGRTKELIRHLEQHRRNFYRFSVCSLEDLHVIFREFTPRELLLVELLPQFPEAPSANFASAGRAMENQAYAWDAEKHTPETCRDFSRTIACISGVVVNMAERSIRLITPANADAQHPTGEYILAHESFADGADYREKLMDIIREKMKVSVEKQRPLRAYPYFFIERGEEGGSLKSRAGYAFVFNKVEEKNASFQTLCEMLLEGKYTRDEIVDRLYDEYQADPLYSYWNINQLWKKGVILDETLL